MSGGVDKVEDKSRGSLRLRRPSEFFRTSSKPQARDRPKREARSPVEARRSAPETKPEPYARRYISYLVFGLALVAGIQILVDKNEGVPRSADARPRSRLEPDRWTFERLSVFTASGRSRRERMESAKAIFWRALVASDGGGLSEDEAALVSEVGAELAGLGSAAFQDFYVLIRNHRHDPRVLEVPLRTLETWPIDEERAALWRCLTLGGELGLRARWRLLELCDPEAMASLLASANMSAAQRSFLVRAQRELGLPFSAFQGGNERLKLSIFVEAARGALPEEASSELKTMLNTSGARRDAFWVLAHSRRPLFLGRLQGILAMTEDDAVFADLCRTLAAYGVLSSAPVMLARYEGAGSYRRLAIEEALGSIAVRRLESDESWEAWWRRLEPLWLELDDRLAELEPGRLPREGRLALLASLEEIREPAVARAAARLLGEDDPELQEAAARVLGTLALPAGERALCALLDCERPRLKSLAHRALRAMSGVELGPDRALWEEELYGETR